MSNSRRLRRKIELVLPEYGLPGGMLLAHPDAARLCRDYFSVAFYLPWTAVPLMQAALDRCREQSTDDEVAAGLASYLEHHIVEEMHGDVPGGEALEDLQVLGVDVDALLSRPAPPAIAQLIGAQYFYIAHAHPVAILGYMEVIEAYHPQREPIERLIEVTGLPRAGFRQLLEHADLDVEHARELDELIDGLPLTAGQEELLGMNALQTVQLATDALLDVFVTPTPAIQAV